MAFRRRAGKLAEVVREVHDHPVHLAIVVLLTLAAFGALVWSALNWFFDDPGTAAGHTRVSDVEPPSSVLTKPLAQGLNPGGDTPPAALEETGYWAQVSFRYYNDACPGGRSVSVPPSPS